MRISDFYKRSRGELVENAEAIEKNILQGTRAGAAGGGFAEWSGDLLPEAAQGILGNHDDQYGGFGQAPKFPQSMCLHFLMAVRGLPGVDAELLKRLDGACGTTLRAMAHGGLYDQFGGGFARYSVDAHWLIPHFEKMLYDNALLLQSYTRGWQQTKEGLYAAVVEETVGWLEREMLADCGGFYSALDADTDGEEGLFYVWDPESVDAAVGLVAGRRVRAAYHITAEGNFEKGRSNPALVEGDFLVRASLADEREQLRRYREANRTHPGRDSKLSTFWNSLTVRALAEAGFAFGRRDWLERAVRCGDFLWERLVVDGEDGLRLRSVYYEGAGAQVDGFLHDYASAADAYLTLAGTVDWLEPGRSGVYLERALALLDGALDLFVDPHGPGFFFTAEGISTPVARRKEWFDNATPSGNGVLLHALSGAYALTGRVAMRRCLRLCCRRIRMVRGRWLRVWRMVWRPLRWRLRA